MEAKVGKLLGLWKLETSENFDEYMKTIDVSFLTRKMGNTAKPNVRISIEGDEVVISSESSIKNHVIKFKLDQEFDETTADGRKSKTTVTMNGTKLVQKQGGQGLVDTTITREVDGKDQLVCVCEAKGVVSTRVYSRTA